jgi:hypothetical protein
MENPRLMIALIAVMDAQMINARVIQPLVERCSKNPVMLPPDKLRLCCSGKDKLS